MTKKIKVGIDFHGVISNDYEFFREFCNYISSLGNEIHILTGASEEDVIRILKKYGIHYDYIYSMFDYYKSIGNIEIFSDGRFYVPEEDWDEAKAIYCEEHNIDIHIDDTSQYGNHFHTCFCLYNKKEKSCQVGDFGIFDFKIPIKELWDKILSCIQ